VKLALHGATGRMGQAIARLAFAADDVHVVGAVAAPGDASVGRDLGELVGAGPAGVSVSEDLGSALLGAEVLIDFSTAGAVQRVAAECVRAGVALMSGTTNLDAATLAALDRAAETIAVAWAPNTSLGVQVLAELVEQAVRRLGPEWDAEIVELHHHKKVDAPSGTAKRLFEGVRAARPEARSVTGRDGDVGARSRDEVGVFGVRGGDVIGDHTVYLLGPGERIELSHRASSRELFAHGALRAARFLVGRAPGRYGMRDVLGGA
jgi:4-hydroxy-tetrahydrodipicolinate reductase